MHIATIYDIHGNVPALEAVLAEIEQQHIDLLVVGGDVIAGPMPRKILSLLRALDVAIEYIWGNAEAELLRCVAGQPIGGLSERANNDARWLVETLTAEEVEFIKSWSNTFTVDVPELGKVLFCHATPYSNIQIFTADTEKSKLDEIFANIEADVVVCGHTHIPFDIAIAGIRVVNSGSVGMPFSAVGAEWLLLDTAIHFMHTNYDLETAAHRIRQSEYPEAESFASNNVLHTPDLVQVKEMISQIEQSQLGQDLRFD